MNRPREIDRLIAIHLFGLDAAEREVVVGGRGWPGEKLWDPGVLPIHGPKHVVRRLVVPGSPGDFVEVERYSTTWAGMGLVIEAMRAADWLVETGHLPREHGCYAVFRRLTIDPIHEDWSAVVDCEGADTMAMAVDLAALAALGVEIPC